MINFLLDVINGGSPQPGSGGSNAVTSNKESRELVCWQCIGFTAFVCPEALVDNFL
jgi:hypothetical protein